MSLTYIQGKSEKTNETIVQVREELHNKINDTKIENKTLVEEIQKETVEKYEQIKNEVHQVREENKEGITQIQTCLLYTSRCV